MVNIVQSVDFNGTVSIYNSKNTNKKNTKKGLDRVIPLPSQIISEVRKHYGSNEEFVFNQKMEK